jgi:hypothetical protein
MLFRLCDLRIKPSVRRYTILRPFVGLWPPTGMLNGTKVASE